METWPTCKSWATPVNRKLYNGGFFFFCKRCIMTYCTLISTEQIDKLKSNLKTNYLMYFNIPSDQAKNIKEYFTVKIFDLFIKSSSRLE